MCGSLPGGSDGHPPFLKKYTRMKRKLFSGLIVLFLITSLAKGQSETYSVSLSRLSSDKYDEFSPVYFKNGLVFCSNRKQGLFSNYFNTDNKRPLGINYVDTSGYGKWSGPRLFSKNLNSKFNDGPASFSRNGDTIYFSRNIRTAGSVRENSNPRNKLGIFSAILEDGKWVKIRDLRFNNEYYNITTPYISPDGQRLFFASDNPAGFGGTDIYYCQWKGNYWDEPVNLGPEINTGGNESYPYVNMEGALFYASDGHPGFGGKDIFYTRQKGQKWLPPVHLDEPVNSQFDDFGFVADSVMGEGYFSSNRNGTVDIFHFTTNIHQIFYCEKQRTNQRCFKFSDEGKIKIDEKYYQLVWNFGDGETAKGQNVEHCFKGPGRYIVRLDVVNIKTGSVFFAKSLYDIELKDIEQPVLKMPLSAMAGESVRFEGQSSAFPESDILKYTWYLGDGARTEGESVVHSFAKKGDYDVQLGLIVRNNRTGMIREVCASRQIRIFDNTREKTAFDNVPVQQEKRLSIFDYDYALADSKYSAEKDYNHDVVFQVEAVTSKMKLDPENKILKTVPQKYRIKEIFLPSEKIYSYVICEEMDLMATRPAFEEISGLGFSNARIRMHKLDDPAAKELNNLKKVFGVSADSFFRKNEAGLSSEGTQILDLILGFLTKYPGLKLEIACHSDNSGTASSNQLMTQKRAEAMTNYLILNGISPVRLTPVGYGSNRPVASNISETDRKKNRRIDFVISK